VLPHSTQDASNPALVPVPLASFLFAAEHGSFAAAARRLGVTPAAIGQAVRRLEVSLGVTLLHRTTRRMELTVEGRVVFERARGLVTELLEVAHAASEGRGAMTGPLRVSAPQGLCHRHVAPLVGEFIARFPEVQVSLDASDHVRDFVDDSVDVAFRILRPRDSAIVSRPIARLRAVTVASPSYLAARGEPSHPRELAAHATIAYRHPSSGGIEPASFRVGGRDVRIALSPRCVVNGVDTGCALAAAGVGIAQPPAPYVADWIAAGRLVPILAAHAATPWTLHLCYRSRARMPRRVRAFVDFAFERYAREETKTARRQR
jgi:DNA-binding transcriptional LysR family regulator